MYHVMGKKDHVKSRHAMCKRYHDWGEDPYWEDVYGRIAGFVAGKPGSEGLVRFEVRVVEVAGERRREVVIADLFISWCAEVDGQGHRILSSTLL